MKSNFHYKHLTTNIFGFPFINHQDVIYDVGFLNVCVLYQVRREMDNNTEAEEREQCIELLKAMLEMDPRKRITPSEVLSHPFIDPTAWNHGSS